MNKNNCLAGVNSGDFLLMYLAVEAVAMPVVDVSMQMYVAGAGESSPGGIWQCTDLHESQL